MKTHVSLLAAALFAAATSALGAPTSSKVEGVPTTIATPDGVTLSGTYWGQSGKAPAVLLLHMLGRTRADWEPLAEDLAARGYTVLAVDFRGHGESRQMGKKHLDFTDFTSRDWKGLLVDVRAAGTWLAAQPGVDPGKIAYVGASIGANAALMTGAGDKAVRTVVLLSPGIDYHGLQTERAMEEWGARPVFLVASDKDAKNPTAVECVTRLATLSTGRHAVKVFKGTGHGTELLTLEPTLKTQIEGWLKQNL